MISFKKNIREMITITGNRIGNYIGAAGCELPIQIIQDTEIETLLSVVRDLMIINKEYGAGELIQMAKDKGNNIDRFQLYKVLDILNKAATYKITRVEK
jgi:hypothetical protein